MIYIWDIVKLHTKVVNEQNFVVQVDWRLTAIDGNVTIVRDGIEHFNQPENAISCSFKSFDMLTKDTVMEWVFSRVNKATEERVIANRIYNEKQQTKEATLPWSTNA